jgi:hypothetical protein
MCGALFLVALFRGYAFRPTPIPEMLRLLATSREHAPAEVVAASLLEEMRREAEADGVESAKRSLAVGQPASSFLSLTRR